jgi:hypothetical protein
MNIYFTTNNIAVGCKNVNLNINNDIFASCLFICLLIFVGCQLIAFILFDREIETFDIPLPTSYLRLQ